LPNRRQKYKLQDTALRKKLDRNTISAGLAGRYPEVLRLEELIGARY